MIPSHNQDKYIPVNPDDYLLPDDGMITPMDEDPHLELVVLYYDINGREVEVFSIINLN